MPEYTLDRLVPPDVPGGECEARGTRIMETRTRD